MSRKNRHGLAAFALAAFVLGGSLALTARPASADGFGKIIAAVNQLFGGNVDGAGATTGQALVKQADGSWKPGTITGSQTLAQVLTSAAGANQTGGTDIVPTGGTGINSNATSTYLQNSAHDGTFISSGLVEMRVGNVQTLAASSGLIAISGAETITSTGAGAGAGLSVTAASITQGLVGSAAKFIGGSNQVVAVGMGVTGSGGIIGFGRSSDGAIAGAFGQAANLGGGQSDTVVAGSGIRICSDGNASGSGEIGFYVAPSLAVEFGNTRATTTKKWTIQDVAGYPLQGQAGMVFGWAPSTDASATIDTALSRFGAGIAGLSNSTSGASFRVFNTTDSTSSPTNSEWAELSWATNLLTFQSNKTGTGTLRSLAITFPNMTLASNTLTVTTFAAGQGAAGTPSLMFSANTDRGFFNDTTNTGIGFTVGGTQKATLTATVFQLLSTVNMQCGGVYRSADNAAATPGYTFTNNTDRGIYNDTANSGVGVSVTGTERLFVGATLVWVTGSANFQVDGNTTLVGSTTAKGTGSANGQTLKIDTATELLTLSTSGTTTDTAANLLPAGSMIVAVDCRITTTITTATNWSVGDATVAARFSPANSTLTSGTTSIGLDQLAGTGTSSSRQNAAAKVRITTTGTPGAGAIRITVHYIQMTAPTS